MKILNIHKRIIAQPKEKISELLDSLSSKNDLLWPKDNWPKMYFKKGLREGEVGGHRPIKYKIIKYIKGELVIFEFIEPKSFKGIHKFEVTEINNSKTELRHTIDVQMGFKGLLIWFFAIKPLHDALLEDALNKAENHFMKERKFSKWSFWVRILRKAF